MMKTYEKNLEGFAQERARYSSPGVRVVKIESRGMLCQSGNRSVYERELNEDDFEQL